MRDIFRTMNITQRETIVMFRIGLERLYKKNNALNQNFAANSGEDVKCRRCTV